MSKNLLVRMRIPIIPESRSILFWNWLPVDEEDSLRVEEEGMSLRLWFDLECIKGASRPREKSELSLPGWRWVWATEVLADVTLEGEPDDLAEFVMTTGHRRNAAESTTEEEDLLRQYRRLGERVYSFVLSNVNRLMSYIRTEKAQYWLEEYSIDPSTMGAAFRRFGARVTLDGSEWAEWVPTDVSSLSIKFPSPSQYMDREDWVRAGRFVNSEERPSLVRELLAGAYLLAEKQHRRSALTEAITALEVAVAQFAKAPDADRTFGPIFAERMGVSSLASQSKHLGFSGTLKYLFPVIFTEEQMPTELLKECQEAIDQRNNVVHHGQRDVRQERLDTFLSSINRVCFLLEDYSEAIKG
jgi:hypothetical protein